MKSSKKLLSLLLSALLLFGTVAIGGTVALADDGRVTVNVEFGADHKGYARRYFGSVDGFTVSGSTVSFEVDASATVFDVESDFTESLFEYAPDPHDKSMKRMDSLGLNPIEEYSDGNEYASEDISGNVTDGMTFYILWQKPASVRAVVKSPEIGSEITFVNNYAAGGGNASPTSSPAPSIYVYGNAVLFRSPFHEYTDGFWCDNAEGNWVYGYPYSGFFTGTVAENETYYARFELESDFGYYIDETSVDNIIVNNGVPFAFKDSFSVNAAVTATDSVPVYIIPDKYDCYPGDTVNYTVYMGSVKDFGGIQLKLDIPQGLTFADYALADNLSSTLNVGGYGSVSFNESNKQILGFGCDYTSDAPTALMTFSCTVDEDAQGDAEIATPLCLISDKNASEIPSGYYSALSCVTITSADAETYSVGDTLYYGTYPQSGVTDETTVAALNEKLTDDGWVSYGYYSGTNTWDDGQMTAGDWMKYQDVALDGVRYRAVLFDHYRPYYTGYSYWPANSNQDDNGYSTETTYWFKYEPIEWKVLDPDSGFIVCNSAIDSQAYNNYIVNAEGEYWGNEEKTYRANDYANSSIRTWLNDDFINTAFSTSQQENIKVTELDNSCPYDSNYNSANTSDKIFLLSYNEVTNSAYGFNSEAGSSDTARQRTSSDYVKCQGIYKNSAGNSYWWLRSPDSDSREACGVNYLGFAGFNYYVYNTGYGVVPALKLQNLESDPTGVPVRIDPEMTISTDRPTYEFGDEITVTVTIPADATRIEGSAGTIILKLNGVEIDKADPENGVLEYPVHIPKIGVYTVTAVFEGDDKYSEATAETTFTVNQHISEIELEYDETLYNDETQKIKIAIDSPLATGDVTLSFNGSEYILPLVDGVTYFTTPLLPAGNYDFAVGYPGDDNHTAASASGSIEIIAHAAEMTVTASDVDYGKTATVTATLPDDATGDVTFYLDAADTGKKVNVANGKAECTFENLTIGEHTVEAVFKNDDKYADETKTVTFTVNPVNCPLTINYVYAQGGEAADTYTGEVEIFKDYSIASPEVTGYTPDVETVSGTMGDEDMGGKTVTVTYTANTYTATLIADGETVDEIPFTYGQKSIDLPDVPKKEGHTGEWESYSLGAENITINAIYKPNKYKATFLADGNTHAEFEVEYGQPVASPRTPSKENYDFTGWDAEIPETMPAEDLTFNAVFTPVEYIAKFVNENGETVEEIPYTVETESITPPAVPEKQGYTGKWEDYSLEIGGITVKPVYTNITAISLNKDGIKDTTGYKENQTFKADATDLPEGAEIHWFVNGKDVGTGSSYKVEDPTDDYTVQAKVIDSDGTVLDETETQSVKVKNGFLDKLRWFITDLLTRIFFGFIGSIC